MSKLRVIIGLICIAALLCCSVHAVRVEIRVLDDDDRSEIYGASVYVDGDYEGKTDTDGELTFSHSFNSEYTLEVTKSGYEDWEDDIDEDDTSVTVYLNPEELSLDVVVYDADTATPIDNAKVTITRDSDDDKDSDWTDKDGTVSFDVDEDEDYTIKIVASDYGTVSREVEMDDDDETLQVWLYPEDRFAFKIVDAGDGTPIEGATVIIDDKVEGVTGSDGIFATVLDPGKSYDIEVTHPSYGDYSRELSVEKDVIATEIALSRTVGSVIISVLDENAHAVSGAEVTFDGSVKGATDSNGRLILGQVNAGSHTVAVSADGYTSWEGTCTSDDQGADLQVELISGSVSVPVLTEDADHAVIGGVAIRVNGTYQGVTAADGLFSLSLTPGTYNISGSREGYRTAYANVTVTAGSSGESAVLTLASEGLPLAAVGVVAVVLVLVVVVGVIVARRRRSSSRRSRRPGRRGGF
ncbi:MAG: hypothetical protein PWP08_1629 [Methanofollis sp.]|nr:hypothetical protein [Methanofollis sp.]